MENRKSLIICPNCKLVYIIYEEIHQQGFDKNGNRGDITHINIWCTNCEYEKWKTK